MITKRESYNKGVVDTKKLYNNELDNLILHMNDWALTTSPTVSDNNDWLYSERDLKNEAYETIEECIKLISELREKMK